MPYTDPTPMILAMAILYTPIAMLLTRLMLKWLFPENAEQISNEEPIVVGDAIRVVTIGGELI